VGIDIGVRDIMDGPKLFAQLRVIEKRVGYLEETKNGEGKVFKAHGCQNTFLDNLLSQSCPKVLVLDCQLKERLDQTQGHTIVDEETGLTKDDLIQLIGRNVAV